MCINGAFTSQRFSSIFSKERYSYFVKIVGQKCSSTVWRQIFLENLKAQKHFDEKENKKFDLKQFRKASIRYFFDSLHGISNENIPLSNAIEIMAYCLIDGKVDQESKFEADLYDELIAQLKGKKDGLRLIK